MQGAAVVEAHHRDEVNSVELGLSSPELCNAHHPLSGGRVSSRRLPERWLKILIHIKRLASSMLRAAGLPSWIWMVTDGIFCQRKL